MACTIVEFLQSNLRFSSGCTEPAAIALAASWVKKQVSGTITSIRLRIDPKTYKNAYAVGIPNSDGLYGNEWALLFGLSVGKPELSLEIFSILDESLRKNAIAQALETPVETTITRHSCLYIEVIVTTTTETIVSVIRNTHTNLVTLTVNGKSKKQRVRNSSKQQAPTLCCKPDPSWYEPNKWPELIEHLYQDNKLMDIIRTGITYNIAVAEFGKKYISINDDYGVSAAIFTRMSGDSVPVMSCAGSGNKGLTSVLPAVCFAQQHNASQEKQEKAVLLSTLLTSLVTARFGAVSSVCGAFYGAGVGLIAAFLMILKKSDLFFSAYKNYIAAVTGAYCDGAKGSCSVKGRTAVQAALKSIQLAETGFSVSERDGILGNSFPETLDNLAQYTEHFCAFDDETIRVLKAKTCFETN